MSEFLWNHFVMHMGEKRREYRSDMKSPAAPLGRRDTCYMDSNSIAVSMIKQAIKDNLKKLCEFIFGRTAVGRGGAHGPPLERGYLQLLVYGARFRLVTNSQVYFTNSQNFVNL